MQTRPQKERKTKKDKMRNRAEKEKNIWREGNIERKRERQCLKKDDTNEKP